MSKDGSARNVRVESGQRSSSAVFFSHDKSVNHTREDDSLAHFRSQQYFVYRLASGQRVFVAECESTTVLLVLIFILDS